MEAIQEDRMQPIRDGSDGARPAPQGLRDAEAFQPPVDEPGQPGVAVAVGQEGAVAGCGHRAAPLRCRKRNGVGGVGQGWVSGLAGSGAAGIAPISGSRPDRAATVDLFPCGLDCVQCRSGKGRRKGPRQSRDRWFTRRTVEGHGAPRRSETPGHRCLPSQSNRSASASTYQVGVRLDIGRDDSVALRGPPLFSV